GPTPVSALIHAATMVTAGVYVVARSHIFFEHSETALVVVATIGCATAFFAATIGLVQTDIKRVLAYSTVSQLGYMFLACGVGAFHRVLHVPPGVSHFLGPAALRRASRSCARISVEHARAAGNSRGTQRGWRMVRRASVVGRQRLFR